MVQTYWQKLYCKKCDKETSHARIIKTQEDPSEDIFTDPEGIWECWACKSNKIETKRNLSEEVHLKSSDKLPCCPKCGEEFIIDVQCMVSCNKGDVNRNNGIGYLMELECNKCKTTFPYFRRTCDNASDMNKIIENNKSLVENNVVGNVGVGIAQRMVSSLDAKSVTSLLMGVIKERNKKGFLK